MSLYTLAEPVLIVLIVGGAAAWMLRGPIARLRGRKPVASGCGACSSCGSCDTATEKPLVQQSPPSRPT